MIRFCPNCNTERSLQEMFCEGTILQMACGWDLAGEPIHLDGWRPQAIVTQDTIASVIPAQDNAPVTLALALVLPVG